MTGNTGISIFKVIADEALLGLLAFDERDMSCLYCNKMAREKLEMPESDCENLDLRSLFPAEARGHLRPFSDEIVMREGMNQDVLVKKANGHTLIANVGVKHVQSDGRTILLVMIQDITFQKKLQRELTLKQEEIHKAYEELLEQNRQLKELDHAKDKFVALTTHELRTPLSAIVATAEVLNLRLYESEKQKEEFIRTIHEQGLHLMELVNDILDFAKIRAGKMDFYIEHKPVNELVRKIAESFQNMAEQSQVKIDLRLPSADTLCYYDLLRLKEVLNNVVNNGIKYNRPGGTLTIGAETVGQEFLRIAVRDTGQGIPPDKIQHVFNEFETVGHVSQHHKGTGLGMPISKKLMEGMGGKLYLESVAGVGSTFFVEIPLNKVLAEEMYRARPDFWGDLAA